jgi:hypothetical protein
MHRRFINAEREHNFAPADLPYANVLMSRLHYGEQLTASELRYLQLGLPSSHPINWQMAHNL